MVVSFDVAFQFPVDFRYPNSDSVANVTKHLLDVTATAKEDAQRLADAISAAETRLPLDNACAKETEDMLLALQGARATLGQLAKRKLMSHTQAAPYDPMVLHTALSWATVSGAAARVSSHLHAHTQRLLCLAVQRRCSRAALTRGRCCRRASRAATLELRAWWG